MIRLAYDNLRQRADLVRDGNFLTDGGIETAVVISLFTDRRAEPTDVPVGEHRRGWWADALAQEPGDLEGSRLWLLPRSRQPLADAVAFAEEALRWMVEDGVAAAVKAVSSWVGVGILKLEVAIRKPGEVAFRWRAAWEVPIGV